MKIAVEILSWKGHKYEKVWGKYDESMMKIWWKYEVNMMKIWGH